MPGVGKTTLGLRIASELGLPFVDSDVQIEERAGASGREVAAADGVSALHKLELEVFRDAVPDSFPSVVAAAGCVADDKLAIQRLSQSKALVVYLQTDVGVLKTRNQGNQTHRRPMSAQHLVDLLERRDPIYRRVAHLAIDTESRDADEIAREIASMYRNPRTSSIS